ncbi:MAG TPA: alpha-glucuronidase family glycosyl hydrolase [Bacteroidales bacterium]|nr:alpha-glucuronidase family glycosyl hydrolase [Bacteroidales bacterium]
MAKKYGILTIAFLLSVLLAQGLKADDGYRLWLRYDRVSDPSLFKSYSRAVRGILVEGQSATMDAASRELQTGLTGLLGHALPYVKEVTSNGIVIAGSTGNSPLVCSLIGSTRINGVNDEGFVIRSIVYNKKKIILIAGNEDAGVLYGVFYFLQMLQQHQQIENLNIESSPATAIRLLNHWDNLDRTIERGYAGFSLWNWHMLPGYITQQYIDYARANASVGINGTVLTNVNADALVLTPGYLVKVAALAGVFRPYGIRVYLTARFSAPMDIEGLKTADPLDPDVIKWWKDKVNEIYGYIPDFGGFLVKANSEGQPGPQNYGRSHADGANMLADALAPHNGIVMWRAFVYDNNVPEDRAKQAYNEFTPLDGKFRKNVLIQIKNGPVDFQPREPFHPLFGALPHTQVMPEFQITQEYLGFATHLVYLAPLFEECLRSDTHASGPGTTVADIITDISGSKTFTGMAGVANTGTDRNWTGHPFAQANWFAFGRQAWNPYSSSREIAEEWIRMTITHDPEIIAGISQMMMSSRETAVKYMTPLGLHHIMGEGHHYGPAPWVSTGRADWTSVYYHRADSLGIGFDRTLTGSNAVSQYFAPLDVIYSDPAQCPENLLLWFHHLPWEHKLRSGRTLWDELCYKYYEGAETVTSWLQYWNSLDGRIESELFKQVSSLLLIQKKEAEWWRDACVLYFQSFSERALPSGLKQPEHSLEYYKGLKFSNVPGR